MNDINFILDKGLKMYDKLKQDENGRYKSWEYCYKEFYDAHLSKNIDEKYIDYLCLHLSFYLASWGMYRGSSFLLQKDYKVHKVAIKEILNEKYLKLWGIEVNEYKDEENINLLFELVGRLKEIYNKIRLDVKEIVPQNDISDTLITKILMGTMGCVPAYDRYFIAGIRKYQIASGNFNENSIKMLRVFYNENYEIIEKVRSKMCVADMKYPQMKVIDMCFWQVGYDLDLKKEYN